MAAPRLKERYAGTVMIAGKEHRLVLLPEQGDSMRYPDAVKFVELLGGRLPSRADMLVIAANLPGAVPAEQHWLDDGKAIDARTMGEVIDMRTLAVAPKPADERARAVAIVRRGV
jgi:hypothetical protein